MRTINKAAQSDITPAMALNLLKEGNERFVKNLKFNRNLLQQVNETHEFVEKAAAINVMKATKSLKLKSDLLMDMIAIGQVGIIGAMYEVSTEKVQFYNQTTI